MRYGLCGVLAGIVAATGPQIGLAEDALLVTDATKIIRYQRDTGDVIDHFVADPVTDMQSGFCMAFGPDGDLYVGDTGADEVLRFDGRTGQPRSAFIPAGRGGLNSPYDLIWRGDELFVISRLTDSVLQYDRTGAFVKAFVSSGSGNLSNPTSLAFGPDGDLFIGEGSHIHRYDGTTGEPVNDGLFALGSSEDITFGPDGHLYVLTPVNTVNRFDGQTGLLIDVFAVQPIGTPAAIEFGPDGDLYLATRTPNRIYRYDGQTGEEIGLPVPSSSGGLGAPTALVFMPSTTIEVAADCPADLSPTNDDGTAGNGTVNIDDLLTVIDSFGDCPEE